MTMTSNIPATNTAKTILPWWVPAAACFGPMLVFLGSIGMFTKNDYTFAAIMLTFTGVVLTTSLNIYFMKHLTK